MLYYLLIFETRREDMESLRDKVKERVLAVERMLQEHYSSSSVDSIVDSDMMQDIVRHMQEEIAEQLVRQSTSQPLSTVGASFMLKCQRDKVFEQVVEAQKKLQKSEVKSSESDTRATISEEWGSYQFIRPFQEQQKATSVESVRLEPCVKWQRLSQ